MSRPLVSPAELAQRQGDPDLVIVDCRHRLNAVGAGVAAYLEGHIPGAVHAHLDKDLSRAPGPADGRHPLPNPEAFARTLGALGISNSSWVVAYDDAGCAMAARLWWMLRWLGHEAVSALDGGLAAWTAAGLELRRGPEVPRRAAGFHVDGVKAEWVVDVAELEAVLAAGDAVLIDARAPERFAGRVEPIDPVAGHVPGAVNLPYDRLLAADGSFAAPREITNRIAEVAGDKPAQALIAMCGSGVTACHLLLGMEAAGMGMGRLYAGSWSEWIRDRSRPIARDAPD